MRILADVRLLSRGGASGIEEYTRNLLQALFAADQENEYSLFYNGFRKEPLNLNVAPRPGSGTNIIDWRIPNKILDAGTRFFGWPTIDRLIKTDLVFSPHFNILKTANAPRVVTFHDLSFLHHPYFFSAKQKFWHWLQNIQKQASEAAKIIAVSEFTKSDLVNLLNIPAEKVEVIYSGVAEDFRVIEKKELTGARPFFLSLGTLEPRKNVPAIIRAFNLLKQDALFADWQLVIAGKQGWIHRSIDREAEESPFRSDIVFTGMVKPKERVLLYNLAKVFVYPSFFEGFGFPPLEAQASGCPVVASDRTSLPEVLGKSALLIDPWRTEELAEAMREAALNHTTRERLIKTGFENASKFTWKKTAEETLKIFRDAQQKIF